MAQVSFIDALKGAGANAQSPFLSALSKAPPPAPVAPAEEEGEENDEQQPQHWQSGLLASLKDATGITASGLGSMVTVPLAGYAGAIGSLLGGAKQGSKVVNAIENATTYRPRTYGGSFASRALGFIPHAIDRGADWAGGKTTDVLTRLGAPPWMAAANGATLRAGIDVAPMFLERLLGINPAVRAGALPRVAPEVDAVRQAGFKLTPNQAMARGGVLGRIAESLAGHAKLERSVSRENAPAVTQTAARDVGINGPVTAKSIADAKAAHNAVYDEVAQLGQIPTDPTYRGIVGGQRAPGVRSFPNAADPRVSALQQAYQVPSFDAADAIAKIKELRAAGNDAVYGPSIKYKPAERAYGRTQLTIARALEDQIDRHLQNLSRGEKPAPVTIEGSAASGASPAAASTGMPAVRETPVPVPVKGAALPSSAAVQTLPRLGQELGTQLSNEPIQVQPQSSPPRAPAGSSPIEDWQRQAADLIPRLRAARTGLAKLNNFERAWKAGKGQSVSASNLGKQLERGAPLTGMLRTIAEGAQRFPRAFQDLHKIRDNGPFSNLDLKFAAPLAFLKPESLAVLAGPPGIRALLASDRYQRGAFGPFRSRAPLFSRFNRLMLPVAGSTGRSGNTQR